MSLGALKICLASALLCGTLSTAASAQEPSELEYLTLDRRAMVLDVPEPIASGLISRAEWSPTGRAVLMLRDQVRLSDVLSGKPVGGQSLLIWTPNLKQERELWKSPGPGASVGAIAWLQGTDVALLTADLARSIGAPPSQPAFSRWLVRCDTRMGSIRPLVQVEAGVQLLAAPSSPVVVISAPGKLLGLVRADGIVREFQGGLPYPLIGANGWLTDGRLLMTLAVPREQRERRKGSQFAFDTLSGKVSGPLSREELDQLVAPRSSQRHPSGLQLVRGRATLKEGILTRETRTLWLTGGTPLQRAIEPVPSKPAAATPATPPGASNRNRIAALVSTECVLGALSPRGDSILYVTPGAAWIRAIVPVDRSIVDAMRDRAEQALGLSRMKQVGLALLLYAADHNDTLPDGDGLKEKLGPYIRTPTIFQDFVYEYAGGPLSDIKEPAKTVLGHATVPGGKAVVYADGHVVVHND